nr:hypothetical protein [Tanacetum cinerariifolium]
MSNPTIESSDTSPVKVEATSELSKVSLVNESLKRLKFHLAKFDSVVKKRTTPDALSEQYFDNNDLKAQLQDKDTTICKLKEIIKYMRENNKENKVNHDRSELETINQEPENSVAKLLLENERLCNEINHVKQDLKAQIQDKVFVITSLKNNLRKLKWKEIVKNDAQIPTATAIAPSMFKLDLEPISHKLKNNWDAHKNYIQKTIEYTDTIHRIIERARQQNPSKPLLDSTCRFTKHIHELLVYVSKTSPYSPKLIEKLVAVTPMNKVKKVRFFKPLTSSSNTNKQVKSSTASDSNTPMLPFIGLKHSTSDSRSNSTGNKKNDRILPPPSSNMKNKVEAQHKTVNLNLNKKNHVAKLVGYE